MVRIAKGSGHAVIEVQMLLEEHKRLAKMFKSAHKTCIYNPQSLCTLKRTGFVYLCNDDAQPVFAPLHPPAAHITAESVSCLCSAHCWLG